MRKSPKNKWVFLGYIICLTLWLYYLIGMLVSLEYLTVDQKFIAWLVLGMVGTALAFGFIMEFDVL